MSSSHGEELAGPQLGDALAFIAAAPDGIAIVDTEGKMVLVNRQMGELFGYCCAELQGARVEMLVPPALRRDHTEHRRRYTRAPRVRPMGSAETLLLGLRKDGSQFPVEISLSPIATPEGAMVVAAIRDASARFEAERAIRESEARFHLAVRGSTDGLWDWRIAEGDTQWWSPRFYDLLGYSAEELAPSFSSLCGIAFPEDRELLKNSLRQHLETRAACDMEVRLRTRDRGYRWFHCRGQALWDDSGSVVRMAGSIQDVHERREAAEELRKSRDLLEVRVQERTEQLRSLIHTAGVAIVVVDREGRIQEWNAEAESIFGWQRGEVLGKPTVDLLPVPERPAGHALLQRLLAGEEMRERERVETCKDGAKRVVLWNSTTRRHPRTEEPIGLIACGQDVTQRRREAREREELKRRAEQQGRLAEIGAITAKIVHDLGNPLTGLVMQAQLVQRAVERGAAPGELTEAAAQILATGRHLEEMIGEFRYFSRGQRLEIEHMDVGRFLKEVADTWKVFAEERSITIRVEVAPGLPCLQGDPIKLYRVLDNLIKNAVEAVDAGPGEVVLVARTAGNDRIHLCVEDSGPGVPEGVDVFQLFETTKAQGTGLGLAVCRQIVQAHGGSIEFTAREPAGTTFTVELPLRRS